MKYEWIEWNGGDCPVPPDMVVEVKIGKRAAIVREASQVSWCHRMNYAPDRIIKYRIYQTPRELELEAMLAEKSLEVSMSKKFEKYEPEPNGVTTLKAITKWQPIETFNLSPIDLVLIAKQCKITKNFEYIHAAFYQDKWFLPFDSERDEIATPYLNSDELPTHWKHLPKPPKE